MTRPDGKVFSSMRHALAAIIANGAEEGEVRKKFFLKIAFLTIVQVSQMRECMASEGWRKHKLLPIHWRIKVNANGMKSS